MGQSGEKTREEFRYEIECLKRRIDELEKAGADNRRKQESVRQQNKLLTDIFNAIPFRMYLIDVNDFKVKLMNLSEGHDDVLYKNQPCYFCIHGNNEPCGSTGYPCVLEQVKKANKFVIVENTTYDEAGTPTCFEIQGFPIFDNEGNIIYMIEALVNISKRKIAEEALHESEHKYRKLFQEANDAIFLIDADTGFILDANREVERLLGRPVSEIIGLHHTRLNVPETATYSEDRFRELVRKEHVLEEGEVTRKDGTAVPVYISASVITLRGKKLIQGIFRDITERKQAEMQLLDYQRELDYVCQL